MITIKQGLSAVVQERTFLNRQTKLHQNRLSEAIKKLENQILVLFSEQLVRENGRLVSTKVKLKQAQKLHRELILLFEAEFNTVVSGLTADFVRVADLIEQRFKLFDEAYAFTNISAEIISALQTASLREFTALGITAREQVASALYDAVIVGGQFVLLEREIRSILTGRYSKTGRPMVSYAHQMASDQIMSFHNQLNLAEATRADINYFLYYGNVQLNTRRFCRARVGKIFSQSEIESWTHKWDGKSGPALTHRGGYRCRHFWVPVRQDWFEGNEDEIETELKEV